MRALHIDPVSGEPDGFGAPDKDFGVGLGPRNERPVHHRVEKRTQGAAVEDRAGIFRRRAEHDLHSAAAQLPEELAHARQHIGRGHSADQLEVTGVLAFGQALLFLRGEAFLHATRGKPARDAGEAFARHRAQQGQRAAWLGRVLVQLTADYRVPLRRAQDVQAACQEAYGPAGTEASLVALRELLAVISAHEWRKKGVPVAAVHGSIHPHYGVFSPVRGEYVGLVANAPLPPQAELAFDIGTGSGVLAAVLAVAASGIAWWVHQLGQVAAF